MISVPMAMEMPCLLISQMRRSTRLPIFLLALHFLQLLSPRSPSRAGFCSVS